MIRTSKHNITDITNKYKLDKINMLFINYKSDLQQYIKYIIKGDLPLQKRISSKDLPTILIKHSKYKRDIYIKSSEIIRSQSKKASKKRYNNYKKIYKYFIKNKSESKFVKILFKNLNLNDIYKTKYFTLPNLNNISINLTNELFDIQQGKTFDNFVKIILPFFNKKGTRALQIKIPLKHHRHSNKLKNNGFILKNNIQIKQIYDKTFVNLIWFKEKTKLKDKGKSIGIDLGVNKLLVSSDNQFIGTDMKTIYAKIKNKKRNSNAFYRSLDERTNITNFFVNQLNLNNIKTLCIEDLLDVKKNKSFKNIRKKKFKKKKQEEINDINSRWLYPMVINKLERICEENGIKMLKVSPAYTSQTCSKCGLIDKNSRKNKNFICKSCGYKIDADLNASINIHNKGIYSSFN